ncbi:MAG: hypothetical protein V1711_00110 [bacterium]
MSTICIKPSKTDSRLRAYIAESVREILSDPDFGLDLTTEIKRQLHMSQKTSRRSYVSLATLRKRLG